jgi:hypothetical protein
MEQNWRSLEANLVKVTMPCFQLRAEALHDRDDSNSDPGRDEAIKLAQHADNPRPNRDWDQEG